MCEITDLQFQKGNKDRVNIFVDNEFFSGASLEAIMKFGLKKGDKADEQKLKDFLLVNEKQKAITKATDLVSNYAKTENQVRTYLKEKKFCSEAIDETISKLKEYGFINDKQYVESYVGFKKYVCGKNKIKQELFKKGISKELLNDVDNLLGESQSTCFNVAEKYMRNKEKNSENGVKLNRYLLSRGFDFADINSVIKKIIKEEDDEGWN